MFRLLINLVFVAFIFATTTTSTLAERRVALVIGNSAYEHVKKLPNPLKDANDIAAAFERLSFEVTLLTDQTSRDMRRALRDFARKSARADMAVVYFAGHGIEIGGLNYLIPIDAELREDVDVDYETLSLDQIMRSVQGAKSLRIVLLDACRTNPFAQSMRMTNNTRSVGRGLARVEPSVGTLVSYAAKQGTTADDGVGDNSPYTEALLAHLEQPGLEVQFLFRRVRDQVLNATNRRQEPFTYGSLPGKRLYLKAPEAKPAVEAPKIDTLAIELAYWNAIKDSDDLGVISSYIDKYPEGQFVYLAKAMLSRIEVAAQAKKAKAEAARKAAIEAAAKAEREAKAQEARRAEEERKARELAEAQAQREREAQAQKEREARRQAKLAEAARIEAEARRQAKLKAEAEARAQRSRELAEWQKVRSSNSPADLEAYLIQYPSSTFADLAQARLEAVKRQRLAALQAPTTPNVEQEDTEVPAGEDQRAINLSIQQQLQRHRCNPGRADGSWGRNSRAALQRFSRYGKVKLVGLDPTQQILDLLKSRKGSVCPPICGRREVLKGNRCVAKTCRRGQRLDRSGRCVETKKATPKTKRPKAKKPKVATTRTRAEPARQRARKPAARQGTRGRKCSLIEQHADNCRHKLAN